MGTSVLLNQYEMACSDVLNLKIGGARERSLLPVYLRIMNKAAPMGNKTRGVLPLVETKTQNISSKLSKKSAGYEILNLS
jgi:hypothetical protein